MMCFVYAIHATSIMQFTLMVFIACMGIFLATSGLAILIYAIRQYKLEKNNQKNETNDQNNSFENLNDDEYIKSQIQKNLLGRLHEIQNMKNTTIRPVTSEQILSKKREDTNE